MWNAIIALSGVGRSRELTFILLPLSRLETTVAWMVAMDVWEKALCSQMRFWPCWGSPGRCWELGRAAGLQEKVACKNTDALQRLVRERGRKNILVSFVQQNVNVNLSFSWKIPKHCSIHPRPLQLSEQLVYFHLIFSPAIPSIFFACWLDPTHLGLI
jgi:hypothetical protein